MSRPTGWWRAWIAVCRAWYSLIAQNWWQWESEFGLAQAPPAVFRVRALLEREKPSIFGQKVHRLCHQYQQSDEFTSEYWRIWDCHQVACHSKCQVFAALPHHAADPNRKLGQWRWRALWHDCQAQMGQRMSSLDYFRLDTCFFQMSLLFWKVGYSLSSDMANHSAM